MGRVDSCRPQQFHAHIEKQNLALGLRCERDRSLVRETGAITCGQDQLTQGNLALHNVQPSLSPGRELVDHVLPWVQHGRVHQGVLVDAQRSFATVRRGDDAQAVPALRRAEAFLLIA